MADEVTARIGKALAAFAKLQHLYRGRDIRLSLKGRWSVQYIAVLTDEEARILDPCKCILDVM